MKSWLHRPVAGLVLMLLVGLGSGYGAAAAAAASSGERRVAVGPHPTAIVRGFGGDYYVAVQGPRQEVGDGDGRIVRVSATGVRVLADRLDNPTGLAFTGTEIITAERAAVWGFDAAGRRRLLAGAGDFPERPQGLVAVTGTADGEGVYVAERGEAGRAGERVYRVEVEGVVSVAVERGWHGSEVGGLVAVADDLLVGVERNGGALWRWTVPRGAAQRWGDPWAGGEGLAFDGQHFLYVAERVGGRVWQVRLRDGRRRLVAQLAAAAGVAVNRVAGELAVVDPEAGAVVLLPLPTSE